MIAAFKDEVRHDVRLDCPDFDRTIPDQGRHYRVAYSPISGSLFHKPSCAAWRSKGWCWHLDEAYRAALDPERWLAGRIREYAEAWAAEGFREPVAVFLGYIDIALREAFGRERARLDEKARQERLANETPERRRDRARALFEQFSGPDLGPGLAVVREDKPTEIPGRPGARADLGRDAAPGPPQEDPR